MSFSYWLSVAAVASLPLVAVGETNHPLLDPTDGNVAVPAFVYASAFKNYQPALDDSVSPDKAWHAANDEMQRLGGHAGHMADAGEMESSDSNKQDAHHGHHTSTSAADKGH